MSPPREGDERSSGDVGTVAVKAEPAAGSKAHRRNLRRKQKKKEARLHRAVKVEEVKDEVDHAHRRREDVEDEGAEIVDEDASVGQVKQELLGQDDVEVEYVAGEVPEDLKESDPMYAEFMRIFERFMPNVQPDTAEEAEGGADAEAFADVKDPFAENLAQKEPGALSRKKQRKAARLSVAELKQLVPYPELVETHDPNAADPRTLVYLKAYRHTVPVPRHWCMRRKYLQGKRGQEKVPFELPDYIAQTGIGEMRSSLRGEDDSKKLKSKSRERLQPRVGKMDIDYQVLHDAFFKYQTKPNLTAHGDLYYEGKEFEVKLKSKQPGELSDELKEALGMTDPLMPPPWLVNMQRYGPPPSYPHLRIPGLNAPIPVGASWGYHPGGWGKPPLNEYQQPLYGDVFVKDSDADRGEGPVKLGPEARWWGELEEEEEEGLEEESEEEGEEEKEGGGEEEEEEERGAEVGGKAVEKSEIVRGADEIAAGTASIQGGLTTPDVIELRKQRREGLETPEAPSHKQEVQTNVGSAVFGSDKTYVIPASSTEKPLPKGKDKVQTFTSQDKTAEIGKVDIALAPQELTALDEQTLREKYEKEVAAQKAAKAQDDYSDIIAEQQRKRKRAAGGSKDEKKSKKYKDFKF